MLATDGVFDNLYNEDVADCIARNLQDTILNPLDASVCLADKSFVLGNKKGYYSPFAKGAKEAGKMYPAQGKSDDIAVIAAQIHTRGDEYFKPQAVSTNGLGLNKDNSVFDSVSTATPSS